MPRCPGEPVDVLLELPAQPGLADAGVAVDHEQAGPARSSPDVEQLLDQPQLAVPADQRRLQPVGALAPPPAATTARAAHSGTGSALPLSWWLPTST